MERSTEPINHITRLNIRYSKQLDSSWNQPHQSRIKHGWGGGGKGDADGEQAEHGAIRDDDG